MPRVEAYGTLDVMLDHLRRDLFDRGADLSLPLSAPPPARELRVDAAHRRPECAAPRSCHRSPCRRPRPAPLDAAPSLAHHGRGSPRLRPVAHALNAARIPARALIGPRPMLSGRQEERLTLLTPAGGSLHVESYTLVAHHVFRT